MLNAKNITKTYGEFTALNDVSISIPEGSIFGLLGPNGAGKTTLIRIITQIIAADRGSIWIGGEPLNTNHIHEIGYLPEERGLYKKMKVGEHLLYLAQLKGLSKKEAMDRIKTWFRKFEIGDWWGKKVEDLSKGMQQKIQFIATVLHDPKLIILDEPFSGFDPINANLIKDEILNFAKEGKTIIFSTHRMESVEELCDHIALINKSEKILEGSKKAIKEAHKTNTFDVEHRFPLHGLSDAFIVKNEEKVEEGMYKTSIKIINGSSSNELLKHLIDKVEVHTFLEKIPNMNEIFISKVQGGSYE
ncbi:UNVERIFIED_CONTAM: hypothetical protein GTU68_057878 [Idotea baltica]|nr:hypothetical protein [Idotea baltica]